MTRKWNTERDEIRAKFAAVMTGISRALERPEEADDILRDLKAAEKMDRKVRLGCVVMSKYAITDFPAYKLMHLRLMSNDLRPRSR